jgi:hypothetical protein
MAKYNRQIVYCKDCIHRPKATDKDICDHTINFPDWKCPCRCEDNWYSWVPKDNWFCGNGEDKKDIEENELLRITIDNTLNNLDKIETEFYTLKDLSGINNIEENK